VSVSPTHRRRGILRALMAAQLDHEVGNGDALALLYASQSAIYGRFGYGPATATRWMTVSRRNVRMRAGVGDSPVRLVTSPEARALVPALWDRYRTVQPGALSRSDRWWDFMFLDRSWQRGGGSEQYWVLHADGFASYRMHDQWESGIANFGVTVFDVATATPEAHAALWRYLLSIELAGEVQFRSFALDDPLPFLVDEPRQLRTTALNDGLWARVLDPQAVLGTRRYSSDDALVIELNDDLVPTAAGRWRVEGGVDGAECTPVDAAPDLVLGPSALGSIVLGGHRPSTLARAGLIEERTPGALRRADPFFAAERDPTNSTYF